MIIYIQHIDKLIVVYERRLLCVCVCVCVQFCARDTDRHRKKW